MMNKDNSRMYIHTEIVYAKPMTLGEHLREQYKIQSDSISEGKSVTAHGLVPSWVPVSIFARHNINLGDGDLTDLVDDFIKEKEVTHENGNTKVIVKLINGMTMSDTELTDDDPDMAELICVNRIKDELHSHLKFLYYTAKHGIK